MCGVTVCLSIVVKVEHVHQASCRRGKIKRPHQPMCWHHVLKDVLSNGQEVLNVVLTSLK